MALTRAAAAFAARPDAAAWTACRAALLGERGQRGGTWGDSDGPVGAPADGWGDAGAGPPPPGACDTFRVELPPLYLSASQLAEPLQGPGFSSG
jgi:hypothetical protein